MTDYHIPLILRGRILKGDERTYYARNGGITFHTPDLGRHLTSLPASAASMRDLYAISLDEIIDFMAEVGQALDFSRNIYLQEAFELSARTSGLSESILRVVYGSISKRFTREYIEDLVRTQVGREYLEGWVEEPMLDGRTLSVRAFGARAVHVIAGNSPGVAFVTMLRSAITRSDTIIKLPSNDPLTAAALVRTMVDIDPLHPVTRHISVAYWKGGDEVIERSIYRPRNIEKIVAWGGLASISHITKYLQPGIDLITLDPKQSASIIGRDALRDDAALVDTAQRAARDVGGFNQELCVNARVLYVECDVEDAAELARLNELGRQIKLAIDGLPPEFSTPAQYPDQDLKAEIATLAFQEDFYRVLQGDPAAGAVIVSQLSEPVEFASILANRTANLVPVASIGDAIKRINSASQTIGIYPPDLSLKIRDELALQGAQHLVTLGEATMQGNSGPQDAIEVERRMLKWVRQIS